MADFEHVCAVLCLLTNAAADEDMPQPLSRAAVRRLFSDGAVSGLVLRESPSVDSRILDRARTLLSRAKHVYECLQRYCENGYDVILPSDELWPKRLYALGDRMPQFLFLRGNRALLYEQKISVAGSRDISDAVWHASVRLGRQIAKERFCLTSGGARGVDLAAERGALEAGGGVILVPAQPESRFFEEKHRMDALDAGRLLMLYDSLPDEPFSSPKAIARNHTIYALGEAAVAVAARDGIGGTWRGAADCLAMRCTPVFIPRGEEYGGAGASGLLARGARDMDLSQPIRRQLCLSRQTDLFSLCGEERKNAD